MFQFALSGHGVKCMFIQIRRLTLTLEILNRIFTEAAMCRVCWIMQVTYELTGACKLIWFYPMHVTGSVHLAVSGDLKQSRDFFQKMLYLHQERNGLHLPYAVIRYEQSLMAFGAEGPLTFQCNDALDFILHEIVFCFCFHLLLERKRLSSSNIYDLSIFL